MRSTPTVAPLVLLASLAAPAWSQAPSGYYDTADPSSAGALRASLHAIIDDHQRFPYTSGATDTWDILEQADADPAQPGNVRDVYRNASYPAVGGGNPNYQREHVWPSSYGFPDDNASNYPYSDCHGLFLCNGSYNSERGNKPFRYCNPTCPEFQTESNGGIGGGAGTYPGNSNWSSGFLTFGTFEVWMERRGDIARSLFYMDVRYEGGFHGVTGASEPELVLTDDENLILASNTGSNELLAYMGMLSVLREWHVQDPVDALEMQHHEAVWAHQGNRNPFIDHPEWVAVVFPDPNAGLGDPWLNEFHYDNSGSDVGEFVEVAGPAGLDLAGYQIVAYNGTNGAEYDTEDLSGVLPDQGGCLGTLSFAIPGLQNGSPDGLALVSPTAGVLEFLSYEGSLTATDGPALGLTSIDVGVEEGVEAPGFSLQRIGSGTQGGDFTWTGPALDSPGAVNSGQTFGDACSSGTPPPPPVNLAAAACSTKVQLAWDPSTDPDWAGYSVYRGNQSTGPWTKLHAGLLASNAYEDTSVAGGVSYWYAVSQENTSGLESALSTPLNVVTPGAAAQPWINEFHYDNDGTDTGEFVEVAGPAGLDLSGYSLVGYNGNGGGVYQTVPLSGVLPDQGGCRGALAFAFTGLQNGAPDGLALVAPGDAVLEFLSYEGSFAATGGPAAGLFSESVGQSESSATPIGHSLQRGGSGAAAVDFFWQAAQAETPGAPNAGQSFSGGCVSAGGNYGCINPAGSLSLLSGAPVVGSSLSVGVDNPLGTQTIGSLPVLFLAVAPDPAFPCGTPLPGLGMASAAASGELLVALGGELSFVGAPWQGAGQPSAFPLSIPDNCSLAGAALYLQGALVDPFGPVGIGLTEGLELVIAP